jgi:hypothetical protein
MARHGGCIGEERPYQNNLSEIRLNFLWYFVGHFFKSLNREHYKYRPIGVTLEKIKGRNAWESFRDFLEKQSWTTDNGKAAVSLLDELDKIFKTEIVKEYDDKNNSAIQLLNIDLILPILEAHNDYKKSLPIYKGKISVPDLIQVNWRNLSSGEKAFLDIFSRLFYAKQQLEEIEKGTSTKWIYLLIDEGDLGFHPEWQRQYLNLIIDRVPEIFEGIKLQIILTSHSPFVISDLPKDNVIFLTKDCKTGDSIVKDSLNDMKQTFGANIHTLLSDSFFVESLMGEFAKSKIDSVLKYLNKDSSVIKSNEEVEKIINMIGEPIIKRYLQKELANKRSKKVENDIVELKKEIDELKKQINLKNTEGGQNDTN